MANRLAMRTMLFLCLSGICLPAQQSSSQPQRESANARDWRFGPGVAFHASSLGLGGDVALAVIRRANVRVGFNAFDYGHTFTKDGIGYNGTLSLRSVQALLDLFPFGGGFHISPGVMFYNGNQLTATSSVPSGGTFTLGRTTFLSSSTDPVRGTGKVSLNNAAPMFLIGFGNLVPRSGRRITFSVEAGMAYQGTPDTKLSFAGTACTVSGTNCVNAATDPVFQTHVASEQAKINNDASVLKYYPIVQVGIGYCFGGTK